MKKVSKKDLSLDKETVSGLNNDMSQVPLDAPTDPTCVTGCQQLTCPGHSDDEEAGTCKTFQSVCLCTSENMACPSDPCVPTASQGMCCEPPQTDVCEKYTENNCPTAQTCASVHICQVTVNVCQQTVVGCEPQPYTDENMVESKCFCFEDTEGCVTKLICEGE